MHSKFSFRCPRQKRLEICLSTLALLIRLCVMFHINLRHKSEEEINVFRPVFLILRCIPLVVPSIITNIASLKCTFHHLSFLESTTIQLGGTYWLFTIRTIFSKYCCLPLNNAVIQGTPQMVAARQPLSLSTHSNMCYSKCLDLVLSKFLNIY